MRLAGLRVSWRLEASSADAADAGDGAAIWTGPKYAKKIVSSGEA